MMWWYQTKIKCLNNYIQKKRMFPCRIVSDIKNIRYTKKLYMLSVGDESICALVKSKAKGYCDD